MLDVRLEEPLADEGTGAAGITELVLLVISILSVDYSNLGDGKQEGGGIRNGGQVKLEFLVSIFFLLCLLAQLTSFSGQSMRTESCGKGFSRV